jgi:hypothetical protein
MDSIEKEERGRSRKKSLNLDKKKRGKRRSGSEQGRKKHLGNGSKCGCSYCIPSLSIRVYNTLELKQEMIKLNKEFVM